MVDINIDKAKKNISKNYNDSYCTLCDTIIK